MPYPEVMKGVRDKACANDECDNFGRVGRLINIDGRPDQQPTVQAPDAERDWAGAVTEARKVGGNRGGVGRAGDARAAYDVSERCMRGHG